MGKRDLAQEFRELMAASLFTPEEIAKNGAGPYLPLSCAQSIERFDTTKLQALFDAADNEVETITSWQPMYYAAKHMNIGALQVIHEKFKGTAITELSSGEIVAYLLYLFLNVSDDAYRTAPWVQDMHANHPEAASNISVNFASLLPSNLKYYHAKQRDRLKAFFSIVLGDNVVKRSQTIGVISVRYLERIVCQKNFNIESEKDAAIITDILADIAGLYESNSAKKYKYRSMHDWEISSANINALDTSTLGSASRAPRYIEQRTQAANFIVKALYAKFGLLEVLIKHDDQENLRKTLKIFKTILPTLTEVTELNKITSNNGLNRFNDPELKKFSNEKERDYAIYATGSDWGISHDNLISEDGVFIAALTRGTNSRDYDPCVFTFDEIWYIADHSPTFAKTSDEQDKLRGIIKSHKFDAKGKQKLHELNFWLVRAHIFDILAHNTMYAAPTFLGLASEEDEQGNTLFHRLAENNDIGTLTWLMEAFPFITSFVSEKNIHLQDDDFYAKVDKHPMLQANKQGMLPFHCASGEARNVLLQTVLASYPRLALQLKNKKLSRFTGDITVGSFELCDHQVVVDKLIRQDKIDLIDEMEFENTDELFRSAAARGLGTQAVLKRISGVQVIEPADDYTARSTEINNMVNNVSERSDNDKEQLINDYLGEDQKNVQLISALYHEQLAQPFNLFIFEYLARNGANLGARYPVFHPLQRVTIKAVRNPIAENYILFSDMLDTYLLYRKFALLTEKISGYDKSIIEMAREHPVLSAILQSWISYHYTQIPEDIQQELGYAEKPEEPSALDKLVENSQSKDREMLKFYFQASIARLEEDEQENGFDKIKPLEIIKSRFLQNADNIGDTLKTLLDEYKVFDNLSENDFSALRDAGQLNAFAKYMKEQLNSDFKMLTKVLYDRGPNLKTIMQLAVEQQNYKAVVAIAGCENSKDKHFSLMYMQDVDGNTAKSIFDAMHTAKQVADPKGIRAKPDFYTEAFLIFNPSKAPLRESCHDPLNCPSEVQSGSSSQFQTAQPAIPATAPPPQDNNDDDSSTRSASPVGSDTEEDDDDTLSSDAQSASSDKSAKQNTLSEPEPENEVQPSPPPYIQTSPAPSSATSTAVLPALQSQRASGKAAVAGRIFQAGYEEGYGAAKLENLEKMQLLEARIAQLEAELQSTETQGTRVTMVVGLSYQSAATTNTLAMSTPDVAGSLSRPK